MVTEEQQEELEALRSIYDTDFTDLTSDPPCFMIKLSNLQPNLQGPVSVRFTLPREYPSVKPKIELPMRTAIISKAQQCQLLAHLNTVIKVYRMSGLSKISWTSSTFLLLTKAEENITMPMVFTLVDAAEQWINDCVTEMVDGQREEEEVSTQEDVNIAPVRLEEPKVSGGRWEYVIGLVVRHARFSKTSLAQYKVRLGIQENFASFLCREQNGEGKPSAGKSTFFNAATTLDLARTGAHPFTTIEPNIGKAFYSIPCPCQKLQERCNAVHGHNHKGERNIPVLLKDVAGLVPGAWEGKGKGNRFLNDLLDADVLIHIVDASGQTDEKGEVTTDYDPANDIQWLHEELHQWIYQNVYSKWDNIVKRPSRLVDMFTGYHANRATILTAFQGAGITEKELASISTWNESVLHRIVDSFLQVRFPIMLVLNKADMETSPTIVERLSAAYDHVIPVSARCECVLQKLGSDGVISYVHGQSMFDILQNLSDDDPIKKQLTYIQNSVLNRYDSCNIHEALCRAVKLRQPVYAFPLHCLDTLQSIGRPLSGGRNTLRDCISLRPGTTVEELHTVMCHYPVNLVSGDFVRAETVMEDGKKRPVKKDEEISDKNCIIKIMTTKRTS